MTSPLDNTMSGEKEVLVSFLLAAERALAAKVKGLSDADARRPMVPSGTCLAGLIKHSAYNLAGWFQDFFLGGIDGDLLPWPTDPFVPEPDESLPLLLERFRQQCDIVTEVVANHSLDATNKGERTDTVNLRWIILHAIEELSRHAGHADILREQIDGLVGYPLSAGRCNCPPGPKRPLGGGKSSRLLCWGR